VLGDWYEQGSYLKLDKNGCHAQMLEAWKLLKKIYAKKNISVH
jgi:hypothetical protein